MARKLTHQFETEEAAYKAGQKVGRSWKDDYRPGGPFVHGAHAYPFDAEWVAFAEGSRLRAEAWLRGFDDGLAQRQAKKEGDDEVNKERRKKIEEVISKLEDLKTEIEALRDEEQEFYDNMPEGFQNGSKGDAAQDAISNLENAVGNIESAVSDLEGAKDA